MAKPNWTPKLTDVLKHKTIEVEMHSERTGNDYRADVIPVLRVLSVGSIEEIDGKYRYAIADNTTGLEYEIKVDKKVPVKFGTILEFKEVRGGATSRGAGWYAAADVEVIQRKENA